MPHFSRLTDIITCNLTLILSESPDPAATLREIVDEMNEGLAACRRNVRSSSAISDRLRREIGGSEDQIRAWRDQARELVSTDDEDGAREALRRKAELEDLIAGLRPELDAAVEATQHMLRIQRALEARHAEAVRKLEELTGAGTVIRTGSETAALALQPTAASRESDVEAELQALKREVRSL
jgi:phage shock protein A